MPSGVFVYCEINFLEELTAASPITSFRFNPCIKSRKARICLLTKEFSTLIFFLSPFLYKYFCLLFFHSLSPEVSEVKLSVVLT